MVTSASRRALALSIWGSVALTVGVCALGLHLTWSQYRDMQGILLDAEKRAAEVRRGAVEDHLHERERRALDWLAGTAWAAAGFDDEVSAVARAEGDSAELAHIAEEFPFLRTPFAIAANGEVVAPGLSSSRPCAACADDEPPPAEYLSALRTVHSNASFEVKRDALRALHRTPHLGARWRLRACHQLAALHHAQGQPAQAAAIYTELFSEFGTHLPEMSWPSALHLTLARAEALAEVEPPGDVAGAIATGLAYLARRAGGSPVVQAELFLRRSRDLAARLGLPLAEAIAAAERQIAREQIARAALDSVRDVVRASAPLAGNADGSAGGDANEPRRYVARFGGELLPTVWRLVPAGEGGGARAVGFQEAAEGLRSEIEAWLLREAPESGLRVAVGAESADALSEVVPLTGLSGDLGFITLGRDRGAWEATLRRARRPFAVAGALLAALGLTLVGGLLVFYRGVRREMNLARMKTEFVANVSHELKTPLALIRLCSETLQLDRLREKEQQQRYYDVITRESERLTHLISKVLDFASIEAGKKTYTLEPRDLGPVVRETAEAYFLRLRDKGFSCSCEVLPSLPAVLADEEAVAQALINLLENAVRYSTDVKEVAVRAWSDGQTVRVSVRDRGVGIAKEDHQRIWDDYYRTKAARALGTRGSGLGLSLVRHIVRAHSARVELESAPGTGSVFTLVFPRCAVGTDGAPSARGAT